LKTLNSLEALDKQTSSLINSNSSLESDKNSATKTLNSLKHQQVD